MLLVVLSLFALVPFLWMFSTSLKIRAEVFTFPPMLFPPVPRLENYMRVFQAFPFLRYARSTTFVTISVTIFQTLTSAMAAYAFARLRFPGRERLFLLYLGTLIPSYIMMTDKFLGWVDTFKSLIIPASLGGAPVQIRETQPGEAIGARGMTGVDLLIETSGKSAARQSGMDALNQRGVMVCVGHGEGLQLEVSRDLIAPERAVLGSEYFTYGEFPKNLELLRAHLPSLRQIITHRFPVEAIEEEAFTLFFAGCTGKVLIEQ